VSSVLFGQCLPVRAAISTHQRFAQDDDAPTKSRSANSSSGIKKTRVDNIIELIGNTPHLKINRLFGEGANVYVKLERANPGGSIKDRIAAEMMEDAERRGLIHPSKTTIVEVTSGNTGVGLAMCSAVKGYKCILVMPSSMSVERRRLMSAYGAEIVITDATGGMPLAMKTKDEILSKLGENGWWASQFANPANIAAHTKNTVKEILRDFPEGLDYVIGGVGTGGHMTACGEELKKVWPNVKVVAVQPASAPVLTGGKMAPHRIQGIMAGFVPDNFHGNAMDDILSVSNEEAMMMAYRCAREEGLLVGISSGASLAATAQVLKKDPSARILAFTYDTGERYLSIDDLWAPK